MKLRYPVVEERMKDLCIPKAKVAERLGISVQTLDNKLTGKTEFQFTEIRALSDWWNVPIQDFASRVEEVS